MTVPTGSLIPKENLNMNRITNQGDDGRSDHRLDTGLINRTALPLLGRAILLHVETCPAVPDGTPEQRDIFGLGLFSRAVPYPLPTAIQFIREVNRLLGSRLPDSQLDYYIRLAYEHPCEIRCPDTGVVILSGCQESAPS